jgi:hypothetical protein
VALKKPVKRTRSGKIAWTLSDQERDVLSSSVEQMRVLLSHAASDPDLRRLFPTGYHDDADADAFWQITMHDQLLDRHLASLDTLQLAIGMDQMSEDDAEGALRALNQLRLVLGTKLDVTENDQISDLDPDDPETPARALYDYLGWLQEWMIEALSG